MLAPSTTSFPDIAGEDERPLCDVEDELATLSAHMAAGMCRWLELLGEFDRRRGWTGWVSCAAWLAWRCGSTARTAREHVRVAQALPHLPLIRAAFAGGELSYAKVRALSRVGTAADEETLLGLARKLTASQLERALRVYLRRTTADARDLHDAEELTWQWDEDGSLIVHGRLAPEDGVLFLQAIEAARHRLWKDGERGGGGSAEPDERELRPTKVDALVAVADAALAHEAALRGGGDRYQVVVHVDEAALREGGDGLCLLEDGPAIASETARRLACDASVVTVTEASGIPLDVGRKTRKIPWTLRRALTARDGGCRYPGCENRRFLDAHHVRHWAAGGETKLDNLVLLCRRHHRALHEGACTIDRNGRFFHRHGWRILAVPRPRSGRIEALRESGGKLGPTTLKGGDGDRMDVAMTMGGLFRIIEGPDLSAPGARPVQPWSPTARRTTHDPRGPILRG